MFEKTIVHKLRCYCVKTLLTGCVPKIEFMFIKNVSGKSLPNLEFYLFASQLDCLNFEVDPYNRHAESVYL